MTKKGWRHRERARTVWVERIELNMKKLTTLFAVVALTTTLGLAGCKKNKDQEGADKAAPKTEEKAGEMKKDDMAKPADPNAAKPADPGAAPAAAAGDLPKECGDYKAAIEK